jgi:hypothetical protein
MEAMQHQQQQKHKTIQIPMVEMMSGDKNLSNTRRVGQVGNNLLNLISKGLIKSTRRRKLSIIPLLRSSRTLKLNTNSGRLNGRTLLMCLLRTR